MTSQIRRSAASVPANIAEGYGRDGPGHFQQFLKIAQGSLKELETHLIIAARVGLLSEQDQGTLLSQCDEIGRMLGALIRKTMART
jgi:four helix bundle protein